MKLVSQMIFTIPLEYDQSEALAVLLITYCNFSERWHSISSSISVIVTAFVAMVLFCHIECFLFHLAPFSSYQNLTDP